MWYVARACVSLEKFFLANKNFNSKENTLLVTARGFVFQKIFSWQKKFLSLQKILNITRAPNFFLTKNFSASMWRARSCTKIFLSKQKFHYGRRCLVNKPARKFLYKFPSLRGCGFRLHSSAALQNALRAPLQHGLSFTTRTKVHQRIFCLLGQNSSFLQLII